MTPATAPDPRPASTAAGADRTALTPIDQDVVDGFQDIDDADRPPPVGPTSNIIIAATVVALGVAAIIGSLSLGSGSAEVPAAGTWPLMVSVALVALGLALAAVFRKTDDAERFTRASWLVVAGVATMVAFVALIDVIGFEIPAALLMFAWLRVLGHESWRTSVVVSLGVVVAFYLVFVVAFSVSIPHLF